MITFNVTLASEYVQLAFEEGARVTIWPIGHQAKAVGDQSLYLLIKDRQIVSSPIEPAVVGDSQVVVMDLALDDVLVSQSRQVLLDILDEKGHARQADSLTAVPSHVAKRIRSRLIAVLDSLEAMGYQFTKAKRATAKTQYRFQKQFADIVFNIDHAGSTAQVIWEKRQALVIQAGAKMVRDTPLNKNGQLGFAAKFALTLRQEQADKWDAKKFVTTEAITLKSVNEVGHFLYFAGVNSWLVLQDDEGKSLHEWAKVD